MKKSANRLNSYKLNILQSLVVLAIPTVIEEIMSTLLQYVDTAMVGHLGEEATAAVSVTTTINWLIGSVAGALGVASISIISQAVGRGDKNNSQTVSSQAFILTMLTSVVSGAMAIGLSPFIPMWMGAEKTIWKTASAYFTILAIPMAFRYITVVMGACIRATKNTKTPMIITLIENILNIVLNYTFIYVLNMGVIGAGIGSAISYTVSEALMFSAYRRNDYLKFEYRALKFDKKVVKKFIKTAYPVALTHSANCMGYVVFAGIVSSMGTTTFAAHSIAVNAEQIFYIAGYGFRSATSTMIGISIGEKDRRKFKTVEGTSIFITIAMMITSGIILYNTALPLMGLFTNSDRVATLGAEVLKIVAFTEPFFGLMIVLEGIYYGLGYTKYVFYAETISMWSIRILFTFLTVKIWNLDLISVWYCMIADNIAKAVFLALPFILKKIKPPIDTEDEI